LDNNIMAEKNKAAWEAAVKAAGNRDYMFRILPKANHSLFEAKVGSNAEAPTSGSCRRTSRRSRIGSQNGSEDSVQADSCTAKFKEAPIETATKPHTEVRA
jgi:hypothetical protein